MRAEIPPQYPTQFDSVASIGEGRTWFVLQVRPQQEYRLGHILLAAGIAYYLPIHRRRYHDGTRTRTVPEICLPGYCFIAGDKFTPEAAREASHGRVLKVIHTAWQGWLRRDLLELEKMNDSGHFNNRGLPTIGRLCNIVSGPLMGLTGEVRKVDQNRGTVTLDADMMGQTVSLELPASRLEVA